MADCLNTPAACMFASIRAGCPVQAASGQRAAQAHTIHGDEPLLNDRAVTLIIYLNDPAGWSEDVGGHLRIHPEAMQSDDEALFASGWEGGPSSGGVAGHFVDVLPVVGNCAIFRSELLHEVMPTVDGRMRLALSMWCVR